MSQTKKKPSLTQLIKLPLLTFIISIFALILASIFKEIQIIGIPALLGTGVSLLYFFVQSVIRLFKKQWKSFLFAILRFTLLIALTFTALGFIMMSHFLGDPTDHFADNLIIPNDIEISRPQKNTNGFGGLYAGNGTDSLQKNIRKVLTVAGTDISEFIPAIPSLRQASTGHAKAFKNYLEASPDWHLFIKSGALFAVRCWSYNDIPKNTLNGYISDFSSKNRFQTRCLISLDCKQWNWHSMQHVQEGTNIVKPEMDMGNNLFQSRLTIECGAVWVEIFEQSDNPERRITKTTISTLEKEFSEFLINPIKTIAQTKAKSAKLAKTIGGNNAQLFHLTNGSQPGIYKVIYLLNPGEPGAIYLKAYEVTKNTPLSPNRLKSNSETRITWSDNPKDIFTAKAGFTIYEGDWGKPYAARFEIWFKPDSGKTERKLAERIYKIEGWQR